MWFASDVLLGTLLLSDKVIEIVLYPLLLNYYTYFDHWNSKGKCQIYLALRVRSLGMLY